MGEAVGAPVPLPVHRIEVDFLPAGQALLLRPDDVVAWRGGDATAPPRVLRDLLGTVGSTTNGALAGS